MNARPGFSTLRESSLHAALKQWLQRPGDGVEVVVDGFTIDLVRDDRLLEIQTRGFGSLKRKLTRLLEGHRVELIHPIAVDKWIVRVDAEGAIVRRRKSPKRGRVEAVFAELVSLAELITHPHFSLTVMLVQLDEIWIDDGRGSWRRRHWSIADRRLLSVSDSVAFADANDYRRLVPPTLSQSFTTRELATALRIPHMLAQKMAYCLRAAGVLQVVGRRGNARVYEVTPNRTAPASLRPTCRG